MLEEEKLLLNSLDVDDCYFFGDHNNNLVPISGHLKKDTSKILAYIDEMIKSLDDEVLNSVIDRGGSL